MDKIEKLSVFDRKTGKRLKPRVYSDGKNQLDVINEVIENFEDKGKENVFLVAGTGSGKSLVAQELIKYYGNGYIVVPRKDHQDQYKNDYSGINSKKFILSDDGKELPIQTLKGKGNYECIFVKGEKDLNPDAKYCDYYKHYCNLSEEDRKKYAPCPHQIKSSFVVDDKALEVAEKEISKKGLYPNTMYYVAVGGLKKINMPSNQTCYYYQQLLDTINTNSVIVNLKKFEIDVLSGNLPKKKLLVLDEADLGLEEISGMKTISLTLLYKKIIKAFNKLDNGELKEALGEVGREIRRFQKEVLEDKAYLNDDGYAISDIDTVGLAIKRFFTVASENIGITSSLKFMQSLNNTIKFDNLNRMTYYFEAVENKSVSLDNENNVEIKISLLNIDIAGKIKRLLAPFDKVLFMSATIQSKRILEKLFGLDNFAIVKGEKTVNGKMKLYKDDSVNFYHARNSDWKAERNTKTQALANVYNGLRDAVGNKQVLFHIVNFSLMPNDYEINKYNMFGFWSKEKYNSYKSDRILQEKFKFFKDKKINFYASTTMLRAIDLPDDMCRITIIQKLPYPYKNRYYKAIEKMFSKESSQEGIEFCREVMEDKCRRELIQASTRGLRHNNDWCIVTSPDIRVVERLEKYLVNESVSVITRKK